MLTLLEKVQKLLEVPDLRTDERKVLQFVISTLADRPLEEQVFPDVRSQIEARFQWYYRPDGQLRRPS